MHFDMIIGFRHKGLEAFYRTGSTRGVQVAHTAKLARILAAIDAASASDELNLPSFKLHPLKGQAQRTLVDMGEWQLARNISLCRCPLRVG
jgi:plasmid maintenance system killer protein